MYGVILEYFQSLYMLEGCKQGSCLNAIGQVITVADNETLMAPYSNWKSQMLYFPCIQISHRSRDGAAFFQKYWHIVGSKVSSACLSFLTHNIMPDGFDDTDILLIPNKQPVESMGELRPISLCNVIYKIVAKGLANRLRKVMLTVVSHTQSAFIKERPTSNNILISFEVLHYLKW